MVAKKSATAGEFSQVPALKLIFLGGPISGQARVFKAGSKVQIGRILKGNTLSIKDAGISSKHLLIQVEDLGQIGWAITDLGSSNGTVLNGDQLGASQPALLSEGSIIKIGEETSIEVKFEATADKIKVDSKPPRRNTRRRVGNQAAGSGLNEEVSEMSLLANDRIEVASEFDVQKETKEKLCLKRTRKQEKKGNLKLNVDEGVTEVGKKLTGDLIGRSTRNSKKNSNFLEDVNAEGLADGTSNGAGQKLVTRRLRSSWKEDNSDDLEKGLGVAEGRRGRKGKRRGNNAAPLEKENVEMKPGSNETEQEKIIKSEAPATEVVENLSGGSTSEIRDAQIAGKNREVKSWSHGNEREKPDTGAAEVVENDASTSEVPDAQVDGRNVEAMAVDLEKMTLGEWLEFLEEALPEQIIRTTDEMINDMRRRAERLPEFLMQQGKDKEQG